MLKIFGTDGIRCKVNQEPMSPDTCLKIAKAAGYILSKKTNNKKRVIISKDTRLSGYLFEPLITSGFLSVGMDVVLVGPLPTPALPMLIKSLRADMGVMITASHNTYEYNGLKFFDSSGDKISKELENKIEKIIFDKKKYSYISNLNKEPGKAFRLEDAKGRYLEYLKSKLNEKIQLKRLKIVLDCANGATYNVAPILFWELGYELLTINDRPNGRNINKKCGAVDIRDLSKNVKEFKADIGFAFDGDGDRIIAVDEKGNEINGDKIIALFAKNYLQEKKLVKKTVVTTVMSNLGLEIYLKEHLGVKLIRTAVGDINVITEMKKNSYILGGEQSGHIILGNFIKTGDGILAALKISEILSFSNIKSSKLFDLYELTPQIKINLPITNKLSKKNNFKLSKLIKKYNTNNKDHRILIRESGTEPLVRLLIESKNIEYIKNLSKKIENEIKSIINE